jgi:hypothetical protein
MCVGCGSVAECQRSCKYLIKISGLNYFEFLVLDGRSLDIVAIQCDGATLKYKSEAFHELGQKISIKLALQKGDKK